jgi:hypothetical protein
MADYKESDIERLVLTGGIHTLDIYAYELMGQKIAVIRCEDNDSITYDEFEGEWLDERETASYHLKVEDIDKLIDKLREVKEYLQG